MAEIPPKREPQEVSIDGGEESKASALQVVHNPNHWGLREESGSPAMEDKQPQSLALQASPLVAQTSERRTVNTLCYPRKVESPTDRCPREWDATDLSSGESQLLRRHPEFRALQSQIAQLRAENAELRRQLRERGMEQVPAPAELKWLIYFRAPAAKAQVLAVVREGLGALLAKDPSFRAR